jgi:hypothetical protein
MASVFKPAGKSKYVIFYTDETGRRRKKAGTTDKAVTERIARNLENRVALRREGQIDVRELEGLVAELRAVKERVAEMRRVVEVQAAGVHSAVQQALYRLAALSSPRASKRSSNGRSSGKGG